MLALHAAAVRLRWNLAGGGIFGTVVSGSEQGSTSLLTSCDPGAGPGAQPRVDDDDLADTEEQAVATTISTTIDIDAGPQAVWAVLTGFAAYGEWNPFMDRVEGAPEVGRKLVVRVRPGGGRGVTFRPTVVAVTPARELRWVGKLVVRGLFDGEHSFVLTTGADGTTRLTHAERFSGLLVPLLKGTLRRTAAGYETFNRALKERVEAARAPR